MMSSAAAYRFLQGGASDSDDSLRFAGEAAGLGIWYCDPAGNLFSGNERFKQRFGLPPA
ncbi:hypothetical protein [Flaviaesturariibacter amylovorans]|uniref:PAS domain-containing protein n=1 Tax=Flaviaesturariibacter amylovorans TaxID=1084520 RepID=A0ABP8HFA7_9BACT